MWCTFRPKLVQCLPRMKSAKIHTNRIFFTSEIVARLKEDIETERDVDQRQLLKTFLPRAEREAAGIPTLNRRDFTKYVSHNLTNIHVSECCSCREISIWLHDKLLYPLSRYELEPNADLDADIRADFDEARAVLDRSPRSAAALLRLCIPSSRQNPKILWIDDAEIVRDPIAQLCPVLRNFLA